MWDCCHGSRVHSDVSCGLRGDAAGVRHRRSKVGLRLGVRVACGAWVRRSTGYNVRSEGRVKIHAGKKSLREAREGRPSGTLRS